MHMHMYMEDRETVAVPLSLKYWTRIISLTHPSFFSLSTLNLW